MQPCGGFNVRCGGTTDLKNRKEHEQNLFPTIKIEVTSRLYKYIHEIVSDQFNKCIANNDLIAICLKHYPMRVCIHVYIVCCTCMYICIYCMLYSHESRRSNCFIIFATHKSHSCFYTNNNPPPPHKLMYCNFTYAFVCM